MRHQILVGVVHRVAREPELPRVFFAPRDDLQLVRLAVVPVEPAVPKPRLLVRENPNPRTLGAMAHVLIITRRPPTRGGRRTVISDSRTLETSERDSFESDVL